jgi:hypothetical protein
MIPLIERSVPDGRSIASFVFAPADKTDLTLNFIDVRARNGNHILPASHAARTRLTGFEPNGADTRSSSSARPTQGPPAVRGEQRTAGDRIKLVS